jgi:hypothetical protein
LWQELAVSDPARVFLAQLMRSVNGGEANARAHVLIVRAVAFKSGSSLIGRTALQHVTHYVTRNRVGAAAQ